jgi:hypothetical protein
LRCPVDKSDLIVVEYNKIELDHCTQCHGVWFDAGELELLFKSLDLESYYQFMRDIILDSDEAKTSEKRRKCPICSSRMWKKSIGEQPVALIDVCRHGHGFWFDGGEVIQVIKQLAEKLTSKQDSQHRVIDFLGEVIKV